MRPDELADIDADLWRLLEAVATGKLPRRAAEYHGPVAVATCDISASYGHCLYRC